MRKILMTVVALVAFATMVQAQTRKPLAVEPASVVGIPQLFASMFDIYRGWKPAYQEEPFGNSIANWALYANLNFDPARINSLRDWIFSRNEATLRSLARQNAKLIQSTFSNLYVVREVNFVFEREFTPDAVGMFDSWYRCIADSNWTYRSGETTTTRTVGEDGVLSWITYKKGRTAGENGVCMDELTNLSEHYGVVELSIDGLLALGFLRRRHEAATVNRKFVGAEVLRKIIHETFTAE